MKSVAYVLLDYYIRVRISTDDFRWKLRIFVINHWNDFSLNGCPTRTCLSITLTLAFPIRNIIKTHCLLLDYLPVSIVNCHEIIISPTFLRKIFSYNVIVNILGIRTFSHAALEIIHAYELWGISFSSGNRLSALCIRAMLTERYAYVSHSCLLFSLEFL